MKRPLGLWILLSAGFLWLNTQEVYSARRFVKTTTTSTTTISPIESEESIEDEQDTTEADVPATSNVTKPVLTGNPQIDYVHDPNLPKELNGYNLSDYPFYERVPANITFKCDGLHDGFYAGVIYKCQVYHHCLFGMRYDFLCANYTAFDQKTFICQFASEVDCSNSKKFWHRNDALYQAASTTTIKPLVIHTTTPVPPSPPPLVAVPPGSGLGQRRVVGRPYRRRRPYYEYYDDYYDDFYYDDRPRSRGRKRPRPRPRPLYEDDYEDDYDDGRYERRGNGGRRRPSTRRPNKGKVKDRPRYDYDDEEEDKYEYDNNASRKNPLGSNKPSFKKRPLEKTSEEKKEQKTIIKPLSGTIYDRPRVAPKIKPPVPKKEANKYAYKSISTTEINKSQEYEDEYEEEKPKKVEGSMSKNTNGSTTSKDKNKATDDYYYDYEEEEQFDSIKEKTTTTTSTTTTSTTTTSTTTTTPPPLITEPVPQLDQPVIIRLVKRPFLPSRGGNPYTARRLQPVGTRALKQTVIPTKESDVTEPKYESDFRPISATEIGPIQKYIQREPPKSNYKNPLDINVEDFDVTLNDALNPTLPNLPVRGYPTGFDVQNDYSYNNYQKIRQTPDQNPAPANSEYVLKNTPQKYENPQSPQGNIRGQSNGYQEGYYSVIEDNYRPRQIPNTQVYYSRYK